MSKKRVFVALNSIFFLISCNKNVESEKPHVINAIERNNSTNSIQEWHLPELSIAEKKDIVKSVQTVFTDFYVNRLQKLEEFNFDSKEAVKNLTESMDSDILLKNIMNVFKQSRDLHTSFSYPYPARCFYASIPLAATIIYDDINDSEGKTEKIIIDGRLSKNLDPQTYTEEQNRQFTSINRGDEIISITNIGVEGETATEVNAKEALKILEIISQGANDDSSKTRSVNNLFWRNGSSGKTPVGTVKIKLKKAIDGSIDEFIIPWKTIISQEENCAYLHTDSAQVQTNNSGYKNAAADIEINETDITLESNIKTQLITYKNKKIAYISIGIFLPYGQINPEKYLYMREKIFGNILGLREFLIKNKHDIDGILIDVRDNPGGFGSYAQLVANLFTNNFVENIKFETLVSPTNYQTFYNLELNRYYSRLNTLDPLIKPLLETPNLMGYYLKEQRYQLDINQRKFFISPENLFDGDENDTLPLSFNKSETEIIKPIITDKPIAVLTNSNCYSACEVFVSHMKDYRIGKIFGESLRTGGGGANVIVWDDFVKPVVINNDGDKLPIIPNGTKLPKGMSITFAWNKVIRHNAENEREKYIEGEGVLADYVYRKTIRDLDEDSAEIKTKIFEDLIDEHNYRGFYLNR
ncbi:S41 family peptidase [Fluviispira vulneris]|uniref:S41 family peptidase n=1 Tax=Fluviispira vulneris TaxID=2763012 RepID=UPI00164599CD|nr:S41 family peptidase [Fluviispira vulneris]